MPVAGPTHAASSDWLRRAVICLIASGLVAAAFGRLVQHHADTAAGNYSVLLRISSRWFDSNPMMRQRPAVRESLVFDPGGYDAQFTYFAVFDPFVKRYAHAPDNYGHMMDSAPYRFGRIGHAWLTRIIAGADWRRYPATMVWTVVAGCWLSAVMLSLLALHAGRSPWWGLAIAAVPGFWQSVQLALPEPVAAAAILVGYWLWVKGHWLAATIAFALSLMTRETGVLLVLCVSVATMIRGRRAIGITVLLGAAGPLVLWKLHVAGVLYPVWGPDALLYNPRNLGLPFMGLVDLWSQVGSGQYHSGAVEVSRAAVAYSILLICAAGVAAWQFWGRRTVPGAAALGYALIALCLNFSAIWSHVGNAQRGSYELFLWLFVLAASRKDPASPGSGTIAAVMVAALVFVFALSHDAAVIRQAL